MNRNFNIFTSLDLELNQPSDKVIQIGAVKFNILSGDIYQKFTKYVQIDEKLCTDRNICHIPELTGITDEILEEKGVDLVTAYRELRDFHAEPVVLDDKEYLPMLNPVTWGGADTRCLKMDLERVGYEFNNKKMYCFGHRFFDIKTIHQLLMIAKKTSLKGGLKKACNIWDVNFDGRAHDAMVDAYNTAKLAHKIFMEIRGDWADDIFTPAS